MRKLIKFALLLFGLTSLSAMAQKADSVIVIYDNQKTVIPVPGFGKQTSIKMTDSIQIIEIGVSKRKPFDNSFQPLNTLSISESEKPAAKTRWFSEIEAGFISEFVSDKRIKDYNELQPEELKIIMNTKNMNGYRISFSVNEREKFINKKYSYVSGFKFGFSQSFRKEEPKPVAEDTLNHFYYGYGPFTNSSVKFLFPVGFRYHYLYDKSPARINFGSNIGVSMEFKGNQMIDDWGRYKGLAIVLQPYLGMEIGKIGILASTDISFLANKYYLPNYSVFEKNFDTYFSMGISVTYRLF